jgi:hypothetical protein
MASVESKLSKAAQKGAKGDTGTALRASYEIDANADVPEITVAGSPIADIAGNYNLNVTDQGLTQVDPNAVVNESEQFINNFNAIQAANNASIGDVTHRQGTDIPAQTGGLHGTDYWVKKYQADQVNAQLSNLKAATQLQALNDVMNNVKDVQAEKLNQEQRRLKALQAKYIPSFYDYTPNINSYLYDPKAAAKARAAAAAAAGNGTTNAGSGNSGTGAKQAQTAGTLRSSAGGTATALNTATGYFDVYEINPDGTTGKRLYSYDKTGQVVDGSKIPGDGRVIKEYSAPKEDGFISKALDVAAGVTSTVTNPLMGASYIGSKVVSKLLGK